MKKIIITWFVLAVMTPSFSFSDQNIKEPNVSGMFYEANPKRLSDMIDSFLEKAPVEPFQEHVEIIVVPHAGYIYSGAVAAHSFKAVSQQLYKTVIVIGPSHYYGFKGISVWEKGGYKTPLGVAKIDEEIASRIIGANEHFKFDPNIFEREHSIEVEIPFLQRIFKDVKIVPVIMGQMDLSLLTDFTRTLRDIIGDREDILIVISTDLSHYHKYEKANQLDDAGIKAIQSLDIGQVIEGQRLKRTEIDAVFPVMTAMLYAKDKGLSNVQLLKYANSGDVTGDKSRVVGYSAVVFMPGENPAPEEAEMKGSHQKGSPKGSYRQGPKKGNAGSLTFEQKKRLVEIARTTVDEYVANASVPEFSEKDPRLSQEEGAFVTIHKHGQLRGCIGHIIGDGPLYRTVRDMAISSATKDPRFSPLKKEELKDIEVEVSVLSKPRRITDVNEIQMGVHGVIISRGFSNGVFLPQVATETGWNRDEFLSNLCEHKAGLPRDCWKDSRKTVIEIFTAEVFSEKDVEKEGP